MLRVAWVVYNENIFIGRLSHHLVVENVLNHLFDEFKVMLVLHFRL